MAGSETQVAQPTAAIEIRRLTRLSEFDPVFEMQKTIWNYDDHDMIPLRFFVVVNKVGGHIFGAFDAGRLVGFCFAIPGVKPDGRAYLHSHMLGVLPEYRNARVGSRLKLRQKEDALARGIELIEWTFDPLELKNAFLNVAKLGAIIRTYSEDLYGSTSSPLHGGLPTDRCTAEWWLRHEPHTPAPSAERIAYPSDITHIRANDPTRARQIQQANAEKFRDAFSRGLAVTGFSATPAEGVYLLEPWSMEPRQTPQ
jgi:predicted GNAT superfamily acetyltransferase